MGQDTCVRRHSKTVFECSRTKREPIHLKTAKPFSNGAVHTYCYYGITYSCVFNKANLDIIKKIIDYQNGEDDIFVYIVDGNYKCKNISYKFVEKLYEYFEEKKDLKICVSCYSKLLKYGFRIFANQKRARIFKNGKTVFE